MATLTLLRDMDYAAAFIINVALLCFAFPAYNRTKVLAFGYLIWAAVVGILLESAYMFHNSNSSSTSDTLSFLELYHIGIIIYDILWSVGVIKLIQYVLSDVERKKLHPIATATPVMALKLFGTNVRLWLFVSLVLFVPPWFIMDIGTGGDDIKHPIQLWFGLFRNDIDSGQLHSRLIAFTLLFGLSALAIGWVVQCLITMIRDAVRKSK